MEEPCRIARAQPARLLLGVLALVLVLKPQPHTAQVRARSHENLDPAVVDVRAAKVYRLKLRASREHRVGAEAMAIVGSVGCAGAAAAAAAAG